MIIDYISNEEKYNYIHQCKALLLPSSNRAEAFGYSLLEGLFFHRPLITSEIKSGTTFINRHLKTGYVIQKYPTDKEIIKAVNFVNENSDLLNNSQNYIDQLKNFNSSLISLKLLQSMNIAQFNDQK